MRMGTIEDRIKELGYALPEGAAPLANYVPALYVESEGLVYTSGHVPRNPDGSFITGKLGDGASVEDGYAAAKSTALGLLGSLKAITGDLDRVTRVVKLLCMVNCTPDFAEHPAVANGASDLLVEVLGDKGLHARSAVGLASLPANVCVEIEMIVEVSA
jgi:enamine deaminase RidA (YjgF/YER057c/UK114 family)